MATPPTPSGHPHILGLKLSAAGWRCRYHAAIVSTGEAPEDLRQIFKQRNRWCCGCFQVFMSPLAMRLLVRQRFVVALCYLNAPLSYVGTLLTTPLWAAVPALSLYASIHPVRAITPAFVALWVCYFTCLTIVIVLAVFEPSRRVDGCLSDNKCRSVSIDGGKHRWWG